MLTGLRHDVQCQAEHPANCVGSMCWCPITRSRSAPLLASATVRMPPTRPSVSSSAPRPTGTAWTYSRWSERCLAGGDPVTFDGEFYHVTELDPAAVPAPRVFTGSVGPKSLAVTGRLADGWIPPGGSDWLSQLYRESRPYAAGFIYRKHRRHPRRPGPGPLGHRDSPRRPRGHHPLARARITVTVGGATCTTSD